MAEPRDLTGVRGARDTGDDGSLDKPIDIGEKIWMFDPSKYQFLNWMLRNQAKPRLGPVYNHVFYHNEDAPWPNFVQYDGADEASQAVTGIVLASGHGARVTTGSRIFWHRIKEITRLDAVMSTDTTGAVSRNFGRGSATCLLKKGDMGRIIPPAYEQGYTPGSGFSTNLSPKTFYTGIVDYVVEMTGTEVAEKAYGGSIFRRSQSKCLAFTKKSMEAGLIWGALKSDATSYTHPLTAPEGLDNYVTTNVYNMNKISRMDLWDIIGELGMKDGDGLTCSRAFKAMVTMWAMGMVQMDQNAKKDGMSISQVQTPFGLIDLMEADCLNEEAYSMGYAFFVPRNHYEYRPLIFNTNRDIKMQKIDVRGSTGQDVDKIHVWGEFGNHFFEEERFGKIYGLQFAA